MIRETGRFDTTRQGTRNTSKRNGFTLVELVMIIVILGVISIVVVPRLTSISEASVNRDAKLLVNYLTMAQQLAMTRSEPYGVCFDLAGNRYSVSRTDCTDPGNIIPSPENRVDPLRIGYDAAITISPSGTTSVFFDYLGRPTPNGLTITLSAGSLSIPVTVEANTGFVHVN